MVEKNFQIYIVQTTGKCICEIPHWHDRIISPSIKNTPHSILLLKKKCPAKKSFFLERSLH